MSGWYTETLYPDVAQRLRMGTVLHRDRTGLQDLVIFENPLLGRVMALDGVIQTTEGDEHVYHEMLGHVPILAHGAARRVLIIGGGDGGLLRRVLEHPGVERATMVEIDRSVVDLSIEYLPAISAGAFDDPRAELVIADGCRFVKETPESFDVILVDSTDPHGPGAVLFTEEFYRDCKARLAPGGILCTQNGVPFLQPEELRSSHQRLGRLFADASFFVAPVPTYYGGFMAFGWATDDAALRRRTAGEIRGRFAAAGLKTRYYTPDIHVASFALPAFMLDILGGAAAG
ncbi:polyamine aminopropyltransferase [Azospirillum thermophilum]|uniref:Polyamine aminopropyltransferase n=1 Tax=Azospirillum thermophilum TaxID=2202148 RepID=A0A2S2CY32_9PROT|nr:polyamine aminopropyltransferase [Azospirillum thermophilum]AWK89320.1 polyamine aminopropyltransferase [Azospirillum thermophilum]